MALGKFSVSRGPSEAGRAGEPSLARVGRRQQARVPGQMPPVLTGPTFHSAGTGPVKVLGRRLSPGQGRAEGVHPSEHLTWRGTWLQWPGPWLKVSFLEAEVLCPDFILAFISLHKHILNTYCVQALHTQGSPHVAGPWPQGRNRTCSGVCVPMA